MKPLLRLLTTLLLGLTAGFGPAAAQELTIEITQGVEGAVPIAVVPFGWQGAGVPPEDLAGIVAADLARSGRFETLSPRQYLDRPSDLSQVEFPNWRAMGADYVAVGQLRPDPGGYVIQVQLADVFQGSELFSYTFSIGPNQLRRGAHHVSDLIYQQITGEPGAFETRIAYVSALTGAAPPAPAGTVPVPPSITYTLVVADADGYNPQVVLRSPLPVMSPAWSPDANRLAYVSFEGRRSQIVVQDLYSGARRTVSEFPGINGAPAWSPDGRRLAATLSRDGNPEVYIIDLNGGPPRRLTNNTAIDTEPAWSPDGQWIVFTSDRGGSPQLYRVRAEGGSAERLTFDGNYNARASFAPDGRSVALVHRRQGRFHIAVLDLGSRKLQVLSKGGMDESPSFAPNGRMIIYATAQGQRGILAAVSADGRMEQNLVSREGDVRDPAWAPLPR